MDLKLFLSRSKSKEILLLAVHVSEAKEENQLKNKPLEFLTSLFGFLLKNNTKLFL